MGARLYYHGTSAANAKSILETGFRKGTWFADDLANAIWMGGQYVFWVLFDEETRSEGFSWQFTVRRRIPPSRIYKLESHNVQLLHFDPKVDRRLRTLVLREEFGPKAKLCAKCDGWGELGYDPVAESQPRKAGKSSPRKRIPCDRCASYGSLVEKKFHERRRKREANKRS